MREESRACENCKAPFTVDASDFAFYEKIKVPPPTWCPDCRMLRRFLFRSERFLFRQKDAASGKEIFSGIPPQAPVKVYDHDYWWSDKWDPMTYGRDYDFTRPFFVQFKELMYAVPWSSRSIKNLVKSDFCDQAGYLKNCYLCFNINSSEDSAYVTDASHVKNSFDLTEAMRDELSYEGFGIDDCFKTIFSVDCDECNDVWFSRSCIGCSNCFGCVNLRNKSYHIFNKPYTKEQYLEEVKRFDTGSRKGVGEIKKLAETFWAGFPNKFMHGVHNTNVSGEYASYSKNAKFCYGVEEVEDSKYCQDHGNGVRDSYDYTIWGDKSELMYEVLTSGEGCRNVRFTWDCWPANQDVEYSVKCASSTNLFGCVGLKKKSYCIFNKQYSKNEYKTLREKIVQHMDEMPYKDAAGRVYRYGEFFPPEFSPFAYNETIAHDFFPLAKEEVLKRGYQWRAAEKKEFTTTLDGKDLPDHIRDARNTVLKEVVKCATCAKAFRIIPMELSFYRQIGLPLPHSCPECRYRERVKHRNPPKFYFRKCNCAGKADDSKRYENSTTHFHAAKHCPNEFWTAYAPENTAIVYCEQCYTSETI